MFENNIDMILSITIAYFAGSFILTIFFFNLYLLHKKPFLKKWVFAWLFLTMAYISLFYAIYLPEDLLYGIYSFLLVSYAYMFLSANASFLKFRIPKYIKYILYVIYTSIILLTIFTLYVAWSVLIAFITISILCFIVGFNYIKEKDYFRKITGIIIVILSIISFLYPMLVTRTWFMPLGYIVDGMLGLYIGISLIQLYFQAQKDELIILKNKLHHLAHHDPLTDIYNRLFMKNEFNNIEKNNITNVGLLFIDLNNFKQVNDSLGHRKGDEILIKLAQNLKNIIKDEGFVCRFGGDEFIVILYNSTKDKVIHYKNKIINYDHNNIIDNAKLSFAVGASFRDNADQDIYQILDEAEKEMYSIKSKQKK